MTLSCFSIGILTFALGVVPIFWLYLVIMGLVGICIPLFNTPATVLLQEKVEIGFLGRVFGVATMISSSMMPLGMLVFGPAADVIRIEWMLIGTGLLLCLQSVFLIKSPSLVEAGETEQ